MGFLKRWPRKSPATKPRQFLAGIISPMTLIEKRLVKFNLCFSESEQRHMDALKRRIYKYGLEDPVEDDTVGVFPVPEQGTDFTEKITKKDRRFLIY